MVDRGPAGKYLVAFRPGAEAILREVLAGDPGLSIIDVDDDEDGVPGDVILMPLLGVAIMPLSAVAQLSARATELDDVILAIEPEGTKTALSTLAIEAPHFLSGPWDESAATWGLQATGALESAFSGKDVKVAVLDTGIDLTHPDLKHRVAPRNTACFVPGHKGVEDRAQHGTHCAGTAGGPLIPQVGPRYGVAYESELFVGKVLGDDGEGDDSWILRGIHWAVRRGCRVISLSLGSPGCAITPYSRVYEAAAAAALARGTLIVAAAGNDSGRYVGRICPVISPANCPSILAVGALASIEQSSFTIADFSNRGLAADGGEVDLAGPGVFVHSAYPLPIRYMRLDGTSMATPHVAGIAALLFEEDPRRTPRDVWSLLTARAKDVGISSADVGAGLVNAAPIRFIPSHPLRRGHPHPDQHPVPTRIAG